MITSQQKGIHDLETLQGHGYEYRLESYTSGLSEVTFRAYASLPQPHYYRITFQTMLYIQTMSRWKDGDFQLASTDEYEQLANALDLSPSQQKDLLLFVASPPDRPKVLVLCNTLFISQEIPIP